jgi:hypothetical protein
MITPTMRFQIATIRIASGQALVRPLSGDDGGVFPMPLQQQGGGTPDIDVGTGHRRKVPFLPMFSTVVVRPMVQ